MGSSLPNHDAKEQKGQTKKRQKTKQEKPRVDYKLEQKKKNKKNKNKKKKKDIKLYDAWTISTHDACSNAVRISSISL